jgi:hypothetical protein
MDMLKQFAAICVAVACIGVMPADSGAEEALAAPLAPFAPFIGKTYRGTFVNSTPEKPMIDVQRWERILNGQAIRILHSINDGEYGGETIMIWDPEKKSVIYYYFTTAGFYTTGTASFQDGRLISHEKVTGEGSGITEVRATGEILPDGRLHSKAEYLKNGEWTEGHELFYGVDPTAEVRFK